MSRGLTVARQMIGADLLRLRKKRGFIATQRNTVQLGGEWLANTTMEKKLTSGAAA